MNGGSDSSPKLAMRHKDNSLSTTRNFESHRIEQSAGVNGAFSINELLDGFRRVQPNPICSSSASPVDFAVFICPFDGVCCEVILHVIKCLVDDGKAFDLGRKVTKSWISCPEIIDYNSSEEADSNCSNSLTSIDS